MYERNCILLEIYENALKEFKESAYHPHPANLLAMLLLAEKDKFEPLRCCEGVFYKKYKHIINDKIDKVISDFNMSNEEIEAFIEVNGASTGDFEFDKIWYVFAEGFGVMHGEMMYRPYETDYQMYSYINKIPDKSKWYKMTENGLEVYPSNSKNKILHKNNVITKQ